MLLFFFGTIFVLWVFHSLQNRGVIIFCFVNTPNSLYSPVTPKGVQISRNFFYGLRRIKILKGPWYLNVWETLVYSFTIG